MRGVLGVVSLFIVVTQGALENVVTCSLENPSLVVNGSVELTDICQTKCTEVHDGSGAGTPEDNVGIAFALVVAAGLSTSIGAALVFVEKMVTQTNRFVLAASLGFSGGVMLYVSLVEIFVKSIAEFAACDCLWEHEDPEAPAKIMATVTFFSGIVFFLILDFVIHAIQRYIANRGSKKNKEVEMSDQSATAESATRPQQGATSPSTSGEVHQAQQDDVMVDLALEDGSNNNSNDNQCSCPDCAGQTATDDNVNQCTCDDPNCPVSKAQSSEQQQQQQQSQKEETSSVRTPPVHSTSIPICMCDEHFTDGINMDNLDNGEEEEKNNVDLSEEEKTKRLHNMGILTAVAIGLHNFPEGLATFVATLADPAVGAGLAVAIAIHNIPEGLCVSIPIYYATNSRWKGFWLASFSGFAEIIGAGLGYLFLMSVIGPATYAILFGVVAGMMVAIVMKELIPTAHRYDPRDKVSTTSIFIGMVVMALSLCLFLL